MPKILINIEEKILSTAEMIFSMNGYEQTDMREIASQADIAVGTIYLHYRNKEILYLHVIARSWQKRIAEMEEIQKQGVKTGSQLFVMISGYIESMKKRQISNTLWSELTAMHTAYEEGKQLKIVEDIHARIASVFGAAIQQLQPERKNLAEHQKNQLGSYIFMMCVDAAIKVKADTNAQAQMIVDMIAAFIQKSTA